MSQPTVPCAVIEDVCPGLCYPAVIADGVFLRKEAFSESEFASRGVVKSGSGGLSCHIAGLVTLEEISSFYSGGVRGLAPV